MTSTLICFTRVPYGIGVGDVLASHVPQSPEQPGDPLVAVLVRDTRRAIFVTEYGEGFGDMEDWLPSWFVFELAKMFPTFRSHLRHRITEAFEARLWTQEWPEERHLVRHLMVDSRHAYWWARRFPEDKDLMRPLVTTPRDAYRWAEEWPEERHLVKHLVTDPYWFTPWNETFPDDPIPS